MGRDRFSRTGLLAGAALALMIAIAGASAYFGRSDRGPAGPAGAEPPSPASASSRPSSDSPSPSGSRSQADDRPPAPPREESSRALADPEATRGALPAHPVVLGQDPAGHDRSLSAVLHFGRNVAGTCPAGGADGVSAPMPGAGAPSGTGLSSSPADGATAATPGIPSHPDASPPHPDRFGPPPELAETSRVFEVSAFGRYAVTVTSPQGTALRLVDRMAGPSEQDGEAGERDGRLDLFLGPGDHKAVMTGLKAAKTPAEVQVRPFVERNAGTPPRLTELAVVATDLADAEQRSYWIRIDRRQPVFLEAAGRHLADLRLWKDGTWLVDALPEASVSEPEAGKSLAVRRLAVTLDPGLYLLSAYGGAGRIWTEAGAEKPLFLRWGIPALPETGRRRLVAGPFGFDRWRLPKGTNAFHLTLERPGAASLEVAPFNDGAFATGKLAVVDPRSRSRSAGLLAPAEVEQVVTVTAARGTAYVLQSAVAASDYAFRGTGSYLVGTLRALDGEDDPDDTVVLTRLAGDRDGRRVEQVVAARTIELGQDRAWRRRFNVAGVTTLFLGIAQPGVYSVEAKGLDADLALAAFGASQRQQRRSSGGGSWDLDAGLYVLAIEPRQGARGILELTLKGAGAGEPRGLSPAVAGASFLPLRLVNGEGYHLYANRIAGAPIGATVRRLPAEMGDDLPLTLEPCATVAVPLALPGPGTVTAIGVDGARLPVGPVSKDGARTADRPSSVEVAVTAAGTQDVVVANPDPRPVRISLHFAPKEAPAADLPAMSARDLAALPDFPVLKPGVARSADLSRQQSATFLVTVDRPALYRLESTGLLETSGVLRTRVQPSLDQAAGNGVGRNFLLQQYLRAGVYQLSVSPRGRTQGHLGVLLSASPVGEGGTLSPGVAAHAALAAGQGLSYDLEIARAGQYRIRAETIHGPAGLRVEDAGGWPLTNPGDTGDLTRDLEAGHYRLVVLPGAMPARVRVLAEEIAAEPERTGHGPHPLPLDTTVAHRWTEPAAGEPRAPDVWSFDMTAPADIAIGLSAMMQAELKRDPPPPAGTGAGSTGAGVDAGAPLASLTSARPWRGRLEAGHYRLELRSDRPNNRFDYRVTTALGQLVPGGTRRVTAPALIPVSLAGGRMVEITTEGTAEVSATLLDDKGAVVARSNGRADDWNATIAASPAGGSYVLRLETVEPAAAGEPAGEEGGGQGPAGGTETGTAGGGEAPPPIADAAPARADPMAPPSSEITPPDRTEGPILVRLRQFDEVEEPALTASATGAFADGRLHVYPLQPPAADGALVVVAAQSRDAVGLSLDRQRADGRWETVGQASGRAPHLAVSPEGGDQAAAPLRLHAWALDHTPVPVTLWVRRVTPAALAERRLADGIALEPLAGIDPPLGVAVVALDRPGLLRLDQPAASLGWAASGARTLSHGPDVVVAETSRLWFAGAPGDGPVRGRRVQPDASAPLALTLPDGAGAAVPLPLPASGPVLWLAQSRTGQPGIAVGAAGQTVDARTMAFGPGVAAAVLPDAARPGMAGPDAPLVRLWRADRAGGELPLTLRQIAYPTVAARSLSFGITDETLETATRFSLPAGPKRLRLALPPLAVAALLDGSTVVRALWSGETPAAVEADSGAGTLLVLATGGPGGRLSVSLAPGLTGDDAGRTIAPGGLAPLWSANAGDQLVEVASGAEGAKGLLLRLSGAVGQAMLMARDGTLVTGTDLPVTDDAVLLLSRPAGLATLWLDRSGQDGGQAWPPLAALAGADRPPGPGRVALSGASVFWRFETPEPALLHVATGSPVMAGLRRPAGLPELSVWGQGGALHAFLPAGTSLLGLRPLTGGGLAGAADVATSMPQPLTEGLGPKVRLAPGDARLFRFDLDRPAPIGVGVRGSADSARVRLLDAGGATLAEGVVAMTTLGAGRYYLLVENRPDGVPADLQPALVGIRPPDQGAPPDVKRHYWDLIASGEGK
ncbi:MAG: hypothetical protein F8N37_01890 [Telmatospirillum sp.]|nr:hypothetical protein [Telmatospirillum sp.]